LRVERFNAFFRSVIDCWRWKPFPELPYTRF
jgi:hypothetical protein